jgi:exosome complex exonuclease DIS3/RRP44
MMDHEAAEVEEEESSSSSSGFNSSEIHIAPSHYCTHSHFRTTRKRGKILKTVTERYLRDDLGLGCHYVDDNGASKRRVKEASVGTPHYIQDVAHLLALLKPSKPNALVVCDTNVILHNMDILEQSHSVMPNLVFPQTSLVECKANRMVMFDRVSELLREVGDNQRCCIFFPDQHHSQTAHVAEDEKETINDENDARIRNVAAFLGEKLRGSNVQVILLTDDSSSRSKSKGRPYEAKSVRSWVQEVEQHNPGVSLIDLVAQHGMPGVDATGMTAKVYFKPHASACEVSRGIQSGLYYRGVFRCVTPGCGRVTIRKGEDRVAVYIEGVQDQNRALDGDVIALELNPLDKWLLSAPAPAIAPSSKVGIANDTAEPSESDLTNVPDTLATESAAALRPTGRVAGIIRRNFATYSGSIFEKPKQQKDDLSGRERIALEHEREHADGSTTCVFFPVDSKIPPIFMRTTQRERFLGQRIVVAIDSWPAQSPFPLGHYVRTLGEAGSKDVETEVLLQEHNIPYEPFPAAVLACLPPEDYKIEMVPERLDLRHLPVLSIDPPNCKDIDDALHCIVLPNGNYQVGVHIADVTHYVKAGTAIDLEAANRSTSTYLVNKRLDMLPSLLTTDLCSLKGNVDR